MRVALYGFLGFAGILLLILPIAVPVIKTSAEFSMFNTRWDGCSDFAKDLAERGEIVPLLYPYTSVKLGNLKGVLIVIGPDVDFSPLEAKEVKRFLESGGTLFIADDFGTGNSLLEKLGVKARFSEKPLKDIFYSKRAEFPVVVRIYDPKLAFGVKKITLNIPSAITGPKGVIASSMVSMVGKSMKSYPIMSEIKYGKGRIVMLSDPSVLINDMFGENRQFIDNLIGYFGANTFYFDEAHHSDFNPYSVITVYIHRTLNREKAFQLFVAVAILSIVVESGIPGRMIKYGVRWLPKKEENLFEGLPDWVDIKVLKRLINEIKTGSKIGDEYGNRIH